jgi:predicted pyridoxine 5'-phosphate oxidase superfamily flavin-nucleotide-binding protein
VLIVYPSTDLVKAWVFKSVQCDGLDHDGSTGVFCVEVTDGQVVIDDRVQITAETIMMVCKGRHSDKRVRLTFRERGGDRTLYLSDRGLSGQVRGNQRLYTTVHDALLHRPEDA